MTKIDLSIVIVSYNTKKITQNCLESINRSLWGTKIRYEIISVDNNSHDGSKEMLLNYSLDKKNHTGYFQTRTNLGFGRGNNFGVKRATGKYILLLNSDTIILNRSIEKLFNHYVENEKTIHFLGAKLLNKDLTPQPSACRFFTLPVIFASLLLKGDYYGLTRFSPNEFKKVDWVSGACILTKKSYYRRLGGFDKNIFMYMDEIDLLYRAHQLGYKTLLYPGAYFIHLGSGSSNGKTFPIIQVFKGLKYFYKKHHPPLSCKILTIMLKLKALIGIILGKLFNNRYLIETYEKAYQVAQMD